MNLIIKLIPELITIWQSILPSMFLGLFLGNYLRQGNWTKKIEKTIIPFTSFSHLPFVCSLPLALCLLDKIIGFTLLQELRKENKINDDDVLITTIIAKLISALYPLFFLILPLILSTIGFTYGWKFFLLYLSFFFFTFLVGIFWGHFSLPAKNTLEKDNPITTIRNKEEKNNKEKIKIAWQRTIGPFLKMAVIFIFFSSLALWLVKIGIIKELMKSLKTLLDLLGLASSATTLLALTTGTISMLAAIASIAPAFHIGSVTFSQLTITLLVASFLHNLYELWSYDLPLNASIFGSKLGIKTAVINFVLQEFFIFLGIIILILLK